MKTPAQYQREYRQRKSTAAKAAPEATTSFLKRPFNEWLNGQDWSEFADALEWAGFVPPDFSTDEDIGHDPETDGAPRGSIGRAERMAGFLRDAAMLLARHVNDYKMQEIEARIAELESADLSDPANKKQALADIVRLNKIRDRLKKEVRHSFPVTVVKGE
jgi:hypothetical protein